MNVAVATAYTERGVQAIIRAGCRLGFEAPHRFWLHGGREALLRGRGGARRGFRGRAGRLEERRLERLRSEADAQAGNPEAQAAYLRELGQVAPEEVVRRVERGRYASNEGVGKAYLAALVESGRLDRRSLREVVDNFTPSPARRPRYERTLLAAEDDAPALAARAIGTRAIGTRDAMIAREPPARWWHEPGRAPARPEVAAPRNDFAREPRDGLRGQMQVAGGDTMNPVYVKVVGTEEASHLFGGRYAKAAKAGRGVLTSLAAMGILYYFFFQDRAIMRGFGINIEASPEPDSQELKTFDDVRGCEEAKDELKEVVDYLRTPKKFTRLGGKLPKGLLLIGPPGTGKTLLARAIAGEAKRPFFYASGSEFEEMFVGVGARRVRDLFAAAKRHAPCIVFIDEIDAVGAKRNPKDQKHMKMTLNQLLVELDGFNPSDGIIVIAATNIPDTLDKALVRPGRFDRHVTVPNPDVRGREEILSVHTRKIPLGNDVDLRIIARGTPGFSGADLANLANTAALRAAFENAEAVGMRHLEYAKDKILMGSERKSAVISEQSRLLTAFHEGGHALMAIHTEGALPVHKATIVPRGQALGMVSQLPDDDMSSMSRRQMLAQLDICMGGRAAEELIFGKDAVTSGAMSDFQRATQVAEAMVTRYGMSEKLGKVVYEKPNESSETRALIEAEVKRLLDDAYQRSKELLSKKRDELENLANALLEMETLNAEEIKLAAKGELLNVPRGTSPLVQRHGIPSMAGLLQGTQVEVHRDRVDEIP